MCKFELEKKEKTIDFRMDDTKNHLKHHLVLVSQALRINDVQRYFGFFSFFVLDLCISQKYLHGITHCVRHIFFIFFGCC